MTGTKKKWISCIRTLVTVFALWTGTSLMAQTVTVTGQILDENAEPLFGVNIVVKSSTGGAISDLEGNYSIEITPNDTLEFSYVGYLTQQVIVGNQRIINLAMVPSQELLDEVVVVGYGSVRKRDITSSITTVSGDAINQTQQGNFTEALQGLAAGVQVFSTDGSPGASPTVIIRGATSINGNPNPMYVVDGIAIGRNPVSAAFRSGRSPYHPHAGPKVGTCRQDAHGRRGLRLHGTGPQDVGRGPVGSQTVRRRRRRGQHQRRQVSERRRVP